MTTTTKIAVTKSLVLKQAAEETVVERSRSFEMSPGDALEAEVVVQQISGTNATLTVSLDSTNDNQNWKEELSVSGIVAAGAYLARIPQDTANLMASRRVRYRYTLAADSGGVAILAGWANVSSL